MNVPAISARLRQKCAQAALRCVPMLAIMLFGTFAAWGQATTSVRGTISDSSGGSVAGATVTITNSESHRNW